MPMEHEMTENEKKKWYLRGYERAVRQMQRSELRIRELRLNRICPAVIADGMPHASGGSDLSDFAAELDREERKYMKARYLRVKLCREIMDKIERLPNEDEKDVLAFRYIKLMKWEDIAVVDTCTEHLAELDRYSWDEEKDKPEDKNDHTINANQYAWIPYKHLIGFEEDER